VDYLQRLLWGTSKVIVESLELGGGYSEVVKVISINEDMIHEALDEWVYFFKHGTIREDFKSPGILLAAKKLDYLAMGEKERRAYDDYMAYLAEERDIIDTAKEEGRMEEKIEVARKMLRRGVKLEYIAEDTGLTMNKIQELAETVH
jgi:predicted transposase/invertase (TIGR01784 family)